MGALLINQCPRCPGRPCHCTDQEQRLTVLGRAGRIPMSKGAQGSGPHGPLVKQDEYGAQKIADLAHPQSLWGNLK